jgi:predicted ATPase
MQRDHFFVLTGAMGSGKSAILQRLINWRLKCVPEPARQILQEQRAIFARGIPEIDPDLFTQLMLSRATSFYLENFAAGTLTVFDRGIPDLIAYAELFGLDTKIYYNSANLHKYNPCVFWFKGWKDIYKQDEERKMDFLQAYEFGERAHEIYRELGYDVIQVPLLSIDKRAEFIYNKIQSLQSPTSYSFALGK